MSLREKLEKSTSTNNKSFLVYDRGQFLHIAQRLARDAKVYYYLAEEEPYPHKNTDEIGTGYENIEVVDDFWEALGKAGCVVFTDVYNGGLPRYLKEQGIPVFSALGCEEIEEDRKLLKKVLRDSGLPVIPTVNLKGLDAVEKYLEGKEDKWLKCSDYRGDMESQHFSNSFLMQTWFDTKRKDWGMGQNSVEILVEDSINSECETGFDTPMLDGELPENPMIGYDNKNKAYCAMTVKKLPVMLQKIHDKMKPGFKRRGYQAWYSNEIRIAGGKAYYMDCTSRFGSPPSEIYCELYKSFTQNVWDLAHGKMPILEPGFKYGVQLILISDFAERHWLPIQFPKEIERFVKLKNAKKVKDGYLCIPNKNGRYIGSVIALGDDLDKTIEECIERAGMIKGEEIEFDKHAFEGIKESITSGAKYGIKFS